MRGFDLVGIVCLLSGYGYTIQRLEGEYNWQILPCATGNFDLCWLIIESIMTAEENLSPTKIKKVKELHPFFGRALMLPVLDTAVKREM